MQALETKDYFTDYDILKDPYQYFEALRAHGPIYRQPSTGIVFVTGFDEALDVLKNTADFSSAIAVQGAKLPLPFESQNGDIATLLVENRSKFLANNLIVTYDDQPHTFSRSILGRLFTPSRLKANEDYITQLSEELIKKAIASGGCELVDDIAVPFVTLVVADLLGVPADDRQYFMSTLAAGPPAGALDAGNRETTALEFMVKYFANYVEDRRRNPRQDVISELAAATYPDGSQPLAAEIVSLATFLFGAGQDTSAKLLGSALKYIVDEPGLQAQLRENLSLVPALLEETLRLEGSTKITSRVARRDTQIGDFKTPAGTRVCVALSAANRDPRRWDEPNAFRLDRPRIKEHLGFGRGAHVCVGAPLARAELRILIEHLLKFTSEIDFAEDKHGPRGARNISYEPSFIIRGVENLHIKLKPSANFKPYDGPSIAPARVKAAPAKTGYSTGETKLGALMGDPATKAVLIRHFPGIDSDARISMAFGMTLRALQSLAPDRFSAEALDAVDADLALIPAQ